MQIGIVSLFPEMFDALNYGIIGRAIEKKLLALDFWNPRDFTKDAHRTVDDRPYGGGPGMVMMMQPLREALQAAKTKISAPTTVIYLSPQGRVLNQQGVEELLSRQRLILLAGRYEGIDERLINTEIDEEWSVGDYVLSGGELAAMIMIDAMTRLIPGALGDDDSAKQDSFGGNLLDYPHYTRPDDIDGQRVPSVLTSGDHQAIARWRLKQSLGRTLLRRPDLIAKRLLTATEQQLLQEFIEETKCRVD